MGSFLDDGGFCWTFNNADIKIDKNYTMKRKDVK
jgi:hypothetical protein